jgi:phosphoglycolate phosphatase-like HAD superfamily hydrolase
MAAPPLSILFDLDGTVVDSKPGILASCNAALRSLGHRPDSLDIGNLIGPPLEEVLAEVLDFEGAVETVGPQPASGYQGYRSARRRSDPRARSASRGVSNAPGWRGWSASCISAGVA